MRHWNKYWLASFLLITAISSQALVQKSGSSMSDNVAFKALEQGLYRRTPLVHSPALSSLVGEDGPPVYLKLDLLQASGSFKDRGVGHFLAHLHNEQGVSQVISSSGGNAGLAVATVGNKLSIEVKVVVPTTTKAVVIAKLETLNAQVTVHGSNWNEADALARQLVEESQGKAAYISPYDHKLLWEGHSTVVDEIIEECPNVGTIVASVGGGGLLCGILEGLQQRYGDKDIAVIAAETRGADAFGQSMAQGKYVTLDAITSMATSLGAKSVTPRVLELANNNNNSKGNEVTAWQCTDAQAVHACLQLAHEHKWMVEPACGAALAVLNDSEFWQQRRDSSDDPNKRPIVVQVCGGSGVSLELLQQWKKDFDL